MYLPDSSEVGQGYTSPYSAGLYLPRYYAGEPCYLESWGEGIARTKKPRHPAIQQDWSRLLKVFTEAGGLADSFRRKPPPSAPMKKDRAAS